MSRNELEIGSNLKRFDPHSM